MKIAFATAELAPFAKSGGLGDVAASLPPCYRAAGHDVRVYVPYYTRAASFLERAWDTHRFAAVTHAGFTYHFGIYHHVTAEGVDIFLLRFDQLFGREGIYGGKDYGYADNALRFALFQQALLESFTVDNWMPDIIHCNDWHTSLVPAYLRVRAGADPRYGGIRTVFTIHNLAYQGVIPLAEFPELNLPGSFLAPDWVEHFGLVICMKCALLHADWLTTVSPTYAREIQTEERGFGFDGILRGRTHELTGIVNGIDRAIWNPETDPHLKHHYHPGHLLGKSRCKRLLRKRLGLRQEQRTPLCGLVARLTDQKGIDLVISILDTLVERGVQAAFLGSGAAGYEDELRRCSQRHPGMVSASFDFDDPLAHQIEAGADIFLMPSRFEPCGLNQMYSLAYGTIPIVHRTGGLADTVVDFTPETMANGTATGFLFDEPTTEALLDVVLRAIEIFEFEPALWRQLQRSAMSQDFSWQHSAAEYLGLFAKLHARQIAAGEAGRLAALPPPAG